MSPIMIPTAVSASACDLSCLLHETHSDCHEVRSATSGEDGTMSMPPGMDMDSEHGESMMSVDSSVSATPSHAMPIHFHARTEGMTERSEHPMKIGAETTSTPDHLNGISFCAHGLCAQLSTSESPPPGHLCQNNSLHPVPIPISGPVDLWIGFYSASRGTGTPKILLSDCLLTTLRI